VYHIFIDESGEMGTSPNSSKFFLIAVLCTESLKALEKRIWKQKAALYSDGWPQNIEIKGTSLWGSDHNAAIPKKICDRRIQILNDMIGSICASPIKLHYSVARKARLSERLLKADYGIAYNYLCGQLICRAYPNHFAGPIEMVVDQRSKETHHKMKFDGYLETKLFADCNHGDAIAIKHDESHNVPGLQAVDFLSWAMFRHYEHNDSQFAKIVRPIVGYRDDWYSGK